MYEYFVAVIQRAPTRPQVTRVLKAYSSKILLLAWDQLLHSLTLCMVHINFNNASRRSIWWMNGSRANEERADFDFRPLISYGDAAKNWRFGICIPVRAIVLNVGQ